MARYWTSDLHLGHVRINELAQRPFSSVDEMNAELISRWNDTVKPMDVVFILGDLVMGKFAESIQLVEQLNGTKALVPGNHDRVHPLYPHKNIDRALEFAAMYASVGLIILPLTFTCELWHMDDSEREDYVEVTMCHFPYDEDDLGRKEYDLYRPNDMGGWLLHGHTHGRGLPPDQRNPLHGRQIDVGVDLWDYRPVSEDQLLELIEGAEEGIDG